MLSWTVFLVLVFWRTSSVLSVPDSLFYPFGTDQKDYSLGIGDDISSEEIQLKTPIGFYGQRYQSIFVNLNGLLSFETEVPDYRSTFVIPTERLKLIAPFLSDVDTQGAGTVFYRETDDISLLARAAVDVSTHFSGYTRFRPRHLFIATWDKVGYYKRQTDLVNSFQVIIASDGRDSFVTFLYQDDGIQWLRAPNGKDGSNSPDPAGQAAFDSGVGRDHYKLRHSGSEDAGSLASETNVNVPGQWMFHIGAQVKGGIQAADLSTGDEFTFEIESETATCLTAAKQCHRRAQCIDFPTGICCECLPPTFGNGLTCLERVIPQRLNGKVTGVLNGVQLNNLDMHSYIVTKSGRAYTAISRIPQEIGQTMSTLNTVGGVMGWLFATTNTSSVHKPKNGYMYTGGVLNRTANVKFHSGESVRIDQEFYGHDTHNNMRLSTRISGTVPVIPTDAKVTVDDYKAEYRHVQRGEIKTSSYRLFRVNEVAYKYDWDETLMFNECEHDTRPRPATSLLSVTRNFVVFDDRDNAARFAMNSEIQVLTDTDPCREGNRGCDTNADCVALSEGYQCECRAGYTGDGFICEDIDECAVDLDTCDENARCYNAPGSFQCQCVAGYRGDGRSCVRDKRPCGQVHCHEHARCVFNSETRLPMCECGSGYRGDGVTCNPIEFTCNEVGGCGENAECVQNEATQEYGCECNEGYSGDGIECTRQYLFGCQHCDANADCYYDSNVLNYRCRCKEKYTGDGYTCTFIEDEMPNPCDNCDRNAECVLDSLQRFRGCRCNAGFYGDGYRCEAEDCRQPGYCDDNARCTYYEETRTYACICNPGYRGDGRRCEIESCMTTNYCDENAECVQNPRDITSYMCRCKVGYEGDGRVCRSTVVSCNLVNNCHEQAECVYNPETRSYRCRCRPGHEGDGEFCRPKRSNCRYYPQLCDPNASCVLSNEDYVCFCQEGFRGNGSDCSPISEEGNYLIYAQGMSIMRVPFKPMDNDRGNRILYLPGHLAVGIAVDCYDRFFYWTDAMYGQIKRARLDGTDVELIVNGLKSPEGISIDWLARNMYFTDSKLDIVAVARIDGSQKKILFDSDMNEPRAIVTDAGRGTMFWTDWFRRKPQIETAYMDGTNRRVLVSDGLGLPNGLTLDVGTQTLCWGDAGEDVKKIECIRADGRGRRVLTDQAKYPFGVAFLGNLVFWTDWIELGGVQNVYISGGAVNEPVRTPLGGRGRMYGIAAVLDQCPRVSNACSAQNGGCSYICLPTPNGGRSCGCPDNMTKEECEQSLYINRREESTRE